MKRLKAFEDEENVLCTARNTAYLAILTFARMTVYCLVQIMASLAYLTRHVFLKVNQNLVYGADKKQTLQCNIGIFVRCILTVSRP